MFFKKKKHSKAKYFILFCLFILTTLIVFTNIYRKPIKNKIPYIPKNKNNGDIEMNTDKIKNLPKWDLTDLYSSVKDEKINIDLQEAENRIKSFQKNYKGKINNLNGKELYKALIEYEDIQELIDKVASYSFLKYSENLSLVENTEFFQSTKEKITDIYSDILFFELELNSLSEKKINDFFDDSESLNVYKNVIDNIRSQKPHQLNEELEKIFLEKSITSSDAWVRLFDETISNMEFEYKGKKYNQIQFLELMNGKDEKVRKETSKIFGETLSEYNRIFTLIINTIAKDKEINDRWRNFKEPISSRNLSNKIEDEVVESLRETVKNNYKNTSHRFYKWKAKEMGKKKLNYYDRNAPLSYDDDKKYTWEEAKEIVLSSYNEFSPEIAEIAEKFFDNNWIDAVVVKGKTTSQFMCPMTPKTHPYILVSFEGSSNDVTTLAHELGHGIHQTLANKNGYLMSRTPLTLAETASVFGEQLTFRKLLNEETDIKKKKVILANKIQDMLNTVVRQIAFLDFETKVHNERKQGELTSERISEIWMETQKESLGEEVFEFSEEYKYYWIYIPHFIHSPFYVYSYAFGDSLVNSLYNIYLEQPEGFQEKYITLLEGGGSKKYNELLEPFNLNPKDSDFWQNGINFISDMIDELENIEKNQKNK